MRNRIIALLTALVAVALAGCGGGGGGPLAGIDRLGISSGTVTGFGSVIVNGVRYEVNAGTTITVNDGPGGQDDLEVGQQVTVRWRSDDNGASRLATDIDYDGDVEGPVETGSQNAVAGTFFVLGQVIRVTATTSFDPAIGSFAGLTNERPVEVSGLRDVTGVIRATRIRPKSVGLLEVRGTAGDVTAQTLSIGALEVDYSGASLPDGAPGNGDLIEVKGSSFALGRLVATVVEIEDDFTALAGDRDDAELEGFITDFVAPAAQFRVAGVPVLVVAGQTEYDDGRTAADLANNVRVEVEGAINASGVLVAAKVEFKSFDDDDDGDDDALDGRVAANVAAAPNVGAGTVLVGGVTVRVAAATRFEDQRSGVRPFGLANLVVGDFVEARGTPGTGATLTASILERRSASVSGRLRGPASAIALPNLSVLGVPVITGGSTQYRDDDGNAISQADFFAAITTGSEVQVDFIQGGSPVVATVAELEDDDDDDGSGDDDESDDD